MPDIICPVCGETNPADQEFCQSCQSRLKPLPSTQRGADAPIQPGQPPTKKHTAELEPILPEWLREARDKARKTAEEQAVPPESEPAPQPNAAPPDFLAGLQAQKDEDEEELGTIKSEIAQEKRRFVPGCEIDDFGADHITLLIAGCDGYRCIACARVGDGYACPHSGFAVVKDHKDILGGVAG